MNRGRISISVFLCFLMMMFLVVIGCSKSDDPTYTISGTVTGATSVTMNLTGDVTATTTTAADGTYSFSGIPAGTNGAVIPVKAGYTFDPLSSGGHLTANQTGVDFTATTAVPGLLPYTISGNVTTAGSVLAGVTITLSGDADATTTTIADGTYSFPGIALNGNYTVTPSLAGYTFSDISIGVRVSGADSTGNNFTATANVATTYTISGAVTLGGVADAGVTITLSGGTSGTTITATATDGTYSFAGLLPGDYTVTASKAGYTFSAPISITLSANSTGHDFTSTVVPSTFIYTISGTVSGAVTNGVMINLTGAATNHQLTVSGGNYSFGSLANGVYTVTPVLSGYTFVPASKAVTVAGVNSTTGNDFTATANVATTYSISGTVSGQVVSGVTITLSSTGSPTTTTNATGNYSFSGIADGSYTVTPSLTGYTFSPINSAANVSGANVTVPNFVATAIPGTYTQDDLTGTWAFNMLRTGQRGDGTPKNDWIRGRLSIDGSGNVSCVSMSNSTDATGCPASIDWKMTINSSGVISETGVDAADNGHLTMTSNKNFIAGTGTSGSPSYHLAIMQKVVTGTSYSNADLQSKSIVFHDLMVGADNQWNHGDGTTDATGMLSIANNITPSGDDGAQPNAGRLSVDASGTVTVDTLTGFQGFLSADKKTVVGTRTEIRGTSTSYHIMIFQITGQTYTAGALPAGISAAHMLATGSAAFWLHFTSTVASGGVITASDWLSSNSGITNPGTTNHGSISALGTVTITEMPTYHGQVSDDGKFTVATQTNASGVYSLQVNTK